jgi:hypothetical protein
VDGRPSIIITLTITPHFPPVDGSECIQNHSCQPSDLLLKLTSLSSDFRQSPEEKAVLVDDEFNLVTAEDRRKLAAQNFTFGWWKEEGIRGDKEKRRERTRGEAALVAVMPPNVGSGSSTNTFIPFVQLNVGHEEELRKWVCTKRSHDVIRKRIIDFFGSKAEGEGSGK